MTRVFGWKEKAVNSKESNLMYIVDIFYLISPTVSSVLGLCAHYSGKGEGGGWGVNANKNSEFVVVALIGHFLLRGVGWGAKGFITSLR